MFKVNLETKKVSFTLKDRVIAHSYQYIYYGMHFIMEWHRNDLEDFDYFFWHYYIMDLYAMILVNAGMLYHDATRMIDEGVFNDEMQELREHYKAKYSISDLMEA